MQACTGVAYSAFLILPKYFTVNLAATGAELGVVMASYGLANVLAAPLVHPAQRRFDRRTILVATNVLIALVSIGFIAVRDAGPLAMALRALQGAAWALVFPAASHLAARMAPPERLGHAIALHSSSNLVTNAIGMAAVEPMLARLGPAAVFLFSAAMALVAAWLARGLPPDPPRDPGLPGAVTAADGALPRFPLFASVVLGLACAVVFTFHQPIALDRGAPRVADFLVAYTVVAISLRVGAGRVMDRIGYRRMALFSLVAYGFVIAAMAWLDADNLVLLGGLFGAVHGLFYPALVTVALQATSLSRRDAMLAWLNAGFHAGTMGVAPLGFVVEAAGYPAVFFSCGALATLTALGFVKRR